MYDIECVYLNGEFVAPAKAKVSAFDRGFIFGDGVYEVIPVFGGKPFRLSQHLDRLDSSLDAVRLRNPLSHDEWGQVIERLIGQDRKSDKSIYLQITRGAAPRDHAFPGNTTPTVFAYAKAMQYPDSTMVKNGVKAITAPDIRWQRCDIKAIALLANVMLRQQAMEQGAQEAILIGDGMVTEGATSNIFIVVQGVLLTPPKDQQILPGITRDLVVDLAQANDIDCRERPVSEAELRHADEVWTTSSVKEILPVVQVDGSSVGDGKPGPLYARLYHLYQEYKTAFREGRAGPPARQSTVV